MDLTFIISIFEPCHVFSELRFVLLMCDFVFLMISKLLSHLQMWDENFTITYMDSSNAFILFKVMYNC